jgi:hypothetical protein
MVKRRSFLLIAVALVIVASFFVRRLQGPRTPAGQPALVELERSGIDELKLAFNASAGQTRVLVMLSPT